MFRYASFLVILISILFFQSASAQKKVKVAVEKPVVSYFYDGGKGDFEYPSWSADENKKEFVVWSKVDSKGGKFGLAGGVIDAKTKITFINEEYKGFKGSYINILELASGKTVSVTGKFRKEGVGEGSVVYCEELFVAITRN